MEAGASLHANRWYPHFRNGDSWIGKQEYGECIGQRRFYDK